MALEKLANIFTGTRGILAAAALSAVAMVSTFSGAAQADDAKALYEDPFAGLCKTYEEQALFTDTASGKAQKYSCYGPVVGVALYAGPDLGKHSPEKVGQLIKARLAAQGIQSEVFINPDHKHGSSMAYFVNGHSYLENPVDPVAGIKMIEHISPDIKVMFYVTGKSPEIAAVTQTSPGVFK